MLIRKANERDAQQIFQNITDVKKDMDAKHFTSWKQNDPSFEDTKDKIPNTYVIENEQQIIASIVIDEQQSKYYATIDWSLADPKPLVMKRFFVIPSQQGKGIAQKLLSFIESYAKENGYKSIRFGTYSKNTPAIKFYTKLGYASVGQFLATDYMPEPFIAFEKIL